MICNSYVYESEYYYDKDKKQSRSRRKLIGKIDEETGNIVPTGKRGRKKKAPGDDEKPSSGARGEAGRTGTSDVDIQKLREMAGEQEARNVRLRVQMDSMEEGYKKLLTEKDDTIRELRSRVRKLEGAIGRARQSLEKAMGSLDDA